MSTPPKITLEGLAARIKLQVAAKEKKNDKVKLMAKLKRQELYPGGEPTTYQREENWYPVSILREYEIQTCDCCKRENVHFAGDRVELRHKTDRSARRWIRERGELFESLPQRVQILERVVPECWDCYTLGKKLSNLFSGAYKDDKQANRQANGGGVVAGGAQEARTNPGKEAHPEAR